MAQNNSKNDDLTKLLNVAETATTQDMEGENVAPHDVLSFVLYFNIKPGRQSIKKNMLFDLYKHWSKEPLTRRSFHRELGKFLRLRQSGFNFYYKTSLNSIDITRKLFIYLNKRNTDRSKSKPWKSHYELFLSDNDLKEGTVWVEGLVFYRFYFRWKLKKRKRSWLGYDQFHHISKLYFNNRRITSSKIKWFGLNRDLLKEVPEKDILRNRIKRRVKKSKWFKKDKKKSK